MHPRHDVHDVGKWRQPKLRSWQAFIPKSNGRHSYVSQGRKEVPHGDKGALCGAKVQVGRASGHVDVLLPSVSLVGVRVVRIEA